MPDEAGPSEVFTAYPELYSLWSEMSQVLMNGPSPPSPGEREMILAFDAGTAGCNFVFIAHSQAAYAWGIEDGLVDQLLDDLGAAPVEQRMKALLRFVRKLMQTPGEMAQGDADVVFAAGWDEQALHDAIAITARICFMQRLVEELGIAAWTPQTAREHWEKRVKLGYLKLHPELAHRKRPERRKTGKSGRGEAGGRF